MRVTRKGIVIDGVLLRKDQYRQDCDRAKMLFKANASPMKKAAGVFIQVVMILAFFGLLYVLGFVHSILKPLYGKSVAALVLIALCLVLAATTGWSSAWLMSTLLRNQYRTAINELVRPICVECGYQVPPGNHTPSSCPECGTPRESIPPPPEEEP